MPRVSDFTSIKRLRDAPQDMHQVISRIGSHAVRAPRHFAVLSVTNSM